MEEEFNFQAIVWNDPLWENGTFRINSNTLDSLMKSTLSCDFGLMIGTKDDEVRVGSEIKLQASENVIFELGLFMGRVGLTHSAFLVEKELKLMSDVDGITVQFFDKSVDSDYENAVKRIGEYFQNSPKLSVNFFPSATLAATYYRNLIFPVCQYVTRNNGFEITDESGSITKYKDCSIKIMIPEELNYDLNLQFQKIKNKQEYQDVSFPYEGRKRFIHLEAKTKDDKLIFIDLPTILSGINYSIEHLLPDEFREHDQEYKDLLSRELIRFEETLLNLIKKDGFTDMVEVVPYSKKS